jgi:thiamine biosynthesis lipoprotein
VLCIDGHANPEGIVDKKMKSAHSRRRFLQLSSGLLLGITFRPFDGFSRQVHPLKYIERAAFTMGSIVTIKAYCTDEKLCDQAIDEAFHEMKTVDKLMSVFDSESQLSLVNRHSAGKEVPVDSRIIEVLEHANHFSKLTNGAFDVTIEPLMELYGFRDDKDANSFPTDKQIAEVLNSVGMNNVTINKKHSTVGLEQSTTKLDFGGIAVGYAIDRAAAILRSYGIESAIINHSGDIYALGSPPEETGWEVGITDPLHIDNIITTVRIKDQALSTSGNYENFIQADNNTIGHILNPHNGRTASSILSGTVIAPTAIEADALSTGFFVLGIEQSKHVLEQHRNARLIAIVREDNDEKIVRI